MKKQQNNKISLKKLTIARIQADMMHQIKGGSSLPSTTMHSNDDPCVIDP
ncbi:class I lanthipeptide [uncultured Aquimarina sp.]|nr:class I lanthipeptide [uncultured Aquimarina sp.]